jgi:hypothetical protein
VRKNSGPLTDIIKLYSMLSKSDKQKQVGNNVIKCLIKNILSSKLGAKPSKSKDGKLYYNYTKEGSVWLRWGPLWLKRIPIIPKRQTRKVTRPTRLRHTGSAGREVRQPGRIDATNDIIESKLTKEEKRIAKELGIL